MGYNSNNNNGDSRPHEPLSWTNAGDDPEKLAVLSGMSYEQANDGSWIFHDDLNNFDLTISPDVLNIHSNEGYINTMVKLVHELPNSNKKAIPGIILIQDDNTPNRGFHVYSKNRSYHQIGIHTSTFNDGDVELKRVLLHETNHAIDYMYGDMKTTGGISRTKSFKDALKLDGAVTTYAYSQKFKYDRNGHITGKYSDNSLYRKDNKYLLENYAEAASIVQLYHEGYSLHKVSVYNEGIGPGTVTVDEWVKSYPNVYKFVSNQIANYDQSNFQKPDSVNVSDKTLDTMIKRDLIG